MPYPFATATAATVKPFLFFFYNRRSLLQDLPHVSSNGQHVTTAQPEAVLNSGSHP